MKNIAFTEERFRNRVVATGKVLFSATKELRCEDAFHNFQKAYERFASAVDRKDEFYKEGFGDVYLDLVVKRFEFTYEMSWKCIKRYAALLNEAIFQMEDFSMFGIRWQLDIAEKNLEELRHARV